MASFLRSTGPMGNPYWVMSRLRSAGANGVLVTRSLVSSIAWTSVDLSNPGVVAATGIFAVIDSIFDTPVPTSEDPRWPIDANSEGYNLGCLMPGSAFPVGGKEYYWNIVVTMADSSILTIEGQRTTRKNYPTS